MHPLTAEKLELRRQLKRRVAQRDGWKCRYCGSTQMELLTLDHIVALSRGGRDELSNLQILCNPCNQAKGGGPDLLGRRSA